jgi:hypothetical protein
VAKSAWRSAIGWRENIGESRKRKLAAWHQRRIMAAASAISERKWHRLSSYIIETRKSISVTGEEGGGVEIEDNCNGNEANNENEGNESQYVNLSAKIFIENGES